MKRHTTLGRDAILNAERQLGKHVDFLSCAKEIAFCHQEKWDGSGYPQGLRGEEIPVSARLMALADVYDALISRRVYKEGISHEEAVALIRDGRGSHFDPDVVDAFLELAPEFLAIASRFRDSDEERGLQKERLEVLVDPDPGRPDDAPPHGNRPVAPAENER